MMFFMYIVWKALKPLDSPEPRIRNRGGLLATQARKKKSYNCHLRGEMQTNANHESKNKVRINMCLSVSLLFNFGG